MTEAADELQRLAAGEAADFRRSRAGRKGRIDGIDVEREIGRLHADDAAGLAWGLRLKGSDAVAVTLFADRATSEGAFHEGANFAAVMRAPVVLLCNNNQWAISTPLSDQTRAEALVEPAGNHLGVS